MIGIKRGTYKRFKSGETYSKERCTALPKLFKKDLIKVEREYEIRVARIAKTDP